MKHLASIAPAALGLFTPLNKGLKGDQAQVGLGKRSDIRAVMTDMAEILEDTGHRPIHMRELVKTLLHLAGYCNVTASGAGGTWFGIFEKNGPTHVETYMA
eukprot:14592624-Ditylum_brightwellii.AAC.1